MMAIVEVFVTAWSSEPFAGGAYSTLGVGATPGDRLALAQVMEQRVTFAGEHLSVEHPATMHGAYNSGVAAGERLIEAQPEAKTAIVIGAGLSGLAAAQTLRAAGLRVTVLEATQHLGGRARTDRIWDNRAIHPGAAWIHGPLGNPVAALAQSVHIAFPPEPTNTRHVAVAIEPAANGPHRFGFATALDAEATQEVLQTTASVHSALTNAAETHRNSGTPDETIRPTLRRLLDGIADPSIRAAAGTQLMQHFESLLAGSIDDISLHHGDEPYAYPGGDHYITTPLEPLMLELAYGLNVVFESPASAVSIASSSVHISTNHLSTKHLSTEHTTTVHSRTTPGTTTPKTTQQPATFGNEPAGHIATSTGQAVGQTVVADVAVVAVPLIPLQRGAIAFTPDLPEAMHNSLHKIRMGSKTKVFVRFTEKWWGDTHTIWVYPSPSTSPQLDPVASPLWPEWVDATDLAGVPTLFGFVSGLEGKRIADLALTPEGMAQIRTEVENLFAAIQPALVASK
jgi:Flavin containing amine oxidoreductase